MLAVAEIKNNWYNSLRTNVLPSKCAIQIYSYIIDRVELVLKLEDLLKRIILTKRRIPIFW